MKSLVMKGNQHNKMRLNLLKNHLNSSNQINDEIKNYSKKIDSIRNSEGKSNIWSGFYKKSIYEKILHVSKIYKDIDIDKLKNGGLELIRADSMIENCIGLLSLPVGLGLNFLINSKKYSVPMVIEEPSVIAAVSGSAKLIAENNGFYCHSDPSLMITQVHIVETNSLKSKEIILSNKQSIIKNANQICQRMVQRGGGVKDLLVRILEEGEKGKIVIDLIVDVCDSMGANLLNTIAEFVSIYIETLISGKIVLKILSNLPLLRKSTSEFKIPISKLGYKNFSGEEVAKRIIYAYEIAMLDPLRAATHNKGIMNGIDSVALALGQDWRAIESAAHSFACLDSEFKFDQYKSLTYYKIIDFQGEKYLYGKLTLPISLGVIGGAINSNENYKNMFKILGNPNSQELSQIFVSVGLAQNFAALRALVTEGIQKGHMSLHARNIAIRVGVPDRLINEVVNFMKVNKNYSEEAAKHYMESHHLFVEMRKSYKEEFTDKKLSSLFVELKTSKEPILINILLDTKIETPIHIYIKPKKMLHDDIRSEEIYDIIVGKSKSFEWFQEFMRFVEIINLKNQDLVETNMIKKKINLILILQNIISYNLLLKNFEKTKLILESIIQGKTYKNIHEMIAKEPIYLNYGLTLLLELNEIFKYLLSIYVKPQLQNILVKEVNFMFQCFIDLIILWNDYQNNKEILNFEFFNKFFNLRSKRLNSTMLLLTDIAFSDGDLNEEYINSVLALGKYSEIKSTIWRDFTKNGNLNSYELFRQLYKNDDAVEKNFISFKNQEIEGIKKDFTILLTGSNREKILKIDELIQEYYVKKNKAKF